MAPIKTNILSNDVEVEYSKLTSIEHRKKYAQFFTPYHIAELMVKWLIGNKDLKTVLEPAFGLGIISIALLEIKIDICITGYEIDPKIYEKSKYLFDANEKVTINLKDYISNDWDSKYDGIVCNPPYFKFHDYDNKNIIKEIEDKISFKLNGFTNLYTLFLLKSIYQLNTGGRAAYLIPSEFLNSDYGKLVKSYLIKSRVLRHIVVVNFEENVFEGALTNASILFCAKDDQSDGVQFSDVNNLDNLVNIERFIQAYPNQSRCIRYVKNDDLKPEIKWRAYYQDQNALKY